MFRILLDAFHHMPPGHLIGTQIAVGGYQTSYGRYFVGDIYHPNGLAALEAELGPTHQFRLLNEPFTDASLWDADLLLIPTPDYPCYPGASPYRWTPDGVDALLRFIRRGGGVLLLANSFLPRPDVWEENFDLERVSLLFDRLGVTWDGNYMSDEYRILPARSGPHTVGYGAGGRVKNAILPSGFEPLLTYEGNLYGFQGKIGAGRLAVIGDAGAISNGLMCFPGFDNAAFAHDLVAKLAPAWGKAPRTWAAMRYGHLSSSPDGKGFSEQSLRELRPDATLMVDDHYRHLHWDSGWSPNVDETVWANLPIEPRKLLDARQVTLPLRWLQLDRDDGGLPLALDVSVHGAQHNGGVDLHLLGRAQSTDLTWKDLCAAPGKMSGAGTIETTHCIYELRLRLGADRQPLAARWRQGQYVYARTSSAERYGYNILISSDNGLIVPSAAG